MHALVLFCINQYTKFQVPSFTNYKDMIGTKFKKNGHVTLTMPLCHHRVGFDTVYLRTKCEYCSFSRSNPEISLGRQNLKWVT